jgi:uncharacterized protein (DUF1778 family)
MLIIDNQEINSYERLVLSSRDRDLFISVMENPPEFQGKLKSTQE